MKEPRLPIDSFELQCRVSVDPWATEPHGNLPNVRPFKTNQDGAIDALHNDVMTRDEEALCRRHGSVHHVVPEPDSPARHRLHRVLVYE
jgi:hypothetical protein